MTYTPDGSVSKRKIQQLNGQWDPGLRLYLGYTTPHDDWSVFLTWTYYNTESKHKSVNGNTQSPVMVQSWSNIIGANSVYASGHWAFRLNTLDLDLGRMYPLSDYLKLTPYVGLRFASVDFHYKSKYEAFTNTNNENNTFQYRTFAPTGFHGDLDFLAGGFHLGAKADWILYKQWKLAFNLSGSILYGNYDIHEHFQEISLSGTGSQSTGPTVKVNQRYYKNEMNRVRTNLDCFLGLGWEGKVPVTSKSTLMFAIGYEISTWNQLNELFSVQSNDTTTPEGTNLFRSDYAPSEFSKHGNVDFQGLTVKGSFAF